MKKAVAMYDDMVKEGESNEEFQATMPLQRKTSEGQKNSDQVTDKLVSFVLLERRLAMETSIQYCQYNSYG